MLTNAHNFVGHVGYFVGHEIGANDLHKKPYKSDS